MPYQTFKSYETETGRNAHDYVVEGSFDDLLYLCPDVFRDKLNDGEIEEKSEDELAKEYRDQLYQIWKAVGPLLDDGYISDYWLVLTPSVCDSGLLPFTQPQKQNNFIVTRFNYEEIELVEKVIVPSGTAGGTVWLSSDKRKRLASNSTLDVYVVVKVNPEHTDFQNWRDAGKDSKEYRKAIFDLCLTVASDVASYFESPLRCFMPFGTREKFGVKEPVFVEQYFDENAKKTKGWPLGEGYVRGVLRELDRTKLRKYVAFVDLFASTGVQFCEYGLSFEELQQFHQLFKASPWVPIEYPEEDE